MATHNHEVLKVKALEWLYLNAKCKYVATEVPIGKYVFDAVGTNGSNVYIIEAKQERSDFLRECNTIQTIKENIIKAREQFDLDNDKDEYIKIVSKEKERSYKFFDDSLLRLSTHRYIICPFGLITEDELPENWGLLDEEPKVAVKCKGNRIEQKFAAKIMSAIAKKNTRIMLEGIGVEFGKRTKFPELELL